MSQWERYLDKNKDRFIDELLDFVRIPSISALPEHAGDVQRAAKWVADRMEIAGIEGVRIMPTGGHPVVYGEWLHAPGKPTILIYGHFDVQPVDPVELWNHPPFQPSIEDGRVFGRGASDDKGNMLLPILAVEGLLRSEGAVPVNLKFCFEGQEEIGSPQLPEFIADHQELLGCDLALSADGGQWSETEPAILLSIRGVCSIQIDVKGAKTDLHSGTYGGTIQNPLHALVWLLDSLRSPEGRVLVEGFYDAVLDLPEAERKEIARVPFEEPKYLADLGLNEVFGEPEYSTLERAWIRPTLEVNGIWGGFQGEGIKTVLPNEAHAKITCRLVPNQDPYRIVELVTAHINKHAPPGVEISVYPLSMLGKPYVIPADHPGNQAARAVLQEFYGKDPYYNRTGGSIPICGLLLEHLNAYTVSFAFGLTDEGAHAPNEFFRLTSFDLGQRAYSKLLYRLADQGL